jgi:hypothetical protein
MQCRALRARGIRCCDALVVWRDLRASASLRDASKGSVARVVRRVACGFVASVVFAFAFLSVGVVGLSGKVGGSGGGFDASGLRLHRGRVGASIGKVYGVVPVRGEYGLGAVLAVGAGCEVRLLKVDSRGDLRFVRLLAAADPAMASCGLSFTAVARLSGVGRDLVLESPGPGDCEVMPTVLVRPGRADGSFGPAEVAQSRASDMSEAAGDLAVVPSAAPGGRDLLAIPEVPCGSGPGGSGPVPVGSSRIGGIRLVSAGPSGALEDVGRLLPGTAVFAVQTVPVPGRSPELVEAPVDGLNVLQRRAGEWSVVEHIRGDLPIDGEITVAGRPALLVENLMGGHELILRMRADGTFAPAAPTSVSVLLLTAKIDMNQDGRKDAVFPAKVSGPGTGVQIALQRRNGTFGPAVYYPLAGPRPGIVAALSAGRPVLITMPYQGDFYSGVPRAVTLSVFTETGPAARARASSPERSLPVIARDPAALVRIDCSHGVSACLGRAVLLARGRAIGSVQLAIAAGKRAVVRIPARNARSGEQLTLALGSTAGNSRSPVTLVPATGSQRRFACRLNGTTKVAADSVARVFDRPAVSTDRELFGCMYSNGSWIDLGGLLAEIDQVGSDVGRLPVALAGHMVAGESVQSGDGNSVVTEITAYDLARRRTLFLMEDDDRFYRPNGEDITSIAVNPRGDVAWIVPEPCNAIDPYCTSRIAAVWLTHRNHPRLLDRSETIDLTSIHWNGQTFTWRDNGRRRTARP